MCDLNRAVFLDRDGVLCEDTSYITSIEKMHIFSYTREAVEQIHQRKYLAIVVTNQSAVARGMMTEKALIELNWLFQKETGVDAVYYCPHLPPEQDEIKPYRIFCSCRKPGIGMLERAALEYLIDLKNSYMVGDRISDVETGKRAGAKTVYISHGLENEVEADFIYPTIIDFTKSLKPILFG